jgi:antitoxin (DNA-binding transcriptional repressor) of toxin-antitoxin stability system
MGVMSKSSRGREVQMTVTEFKAKCLRVLDELGPAGIVLTKRGRPIARVTPAGRTTGRDLFGALRGEITVLGDIMSTGVEWDAQS